MCPCRPTASSNSSSSSHQYTTTAPRITITISTTTTINSSQCTKQAAALQLLAQWLMQLLWWMEGEQGMVNVSQTLHCIPFVAAPVELCLVITRPTAGAQGSRHAWRPSCAHAVAHHGPAFELVSASAAASYGASARQCAGPVLL